MWGWVVSVILAIFSVGAVWYYKRRDATISGLLTENKEALHTTNELLASLAERAEEAAAKDQAEAAKVTNAKEAADFLNDSTAPRGLFSADPTCGRPSTYLCPSSKRPCSPITRGFAR